MIEAAPDPADPAETPADAPAPAPAAPPGAEPPPSRRRTPPFWAKWPDDKLLDLRMSELNLSIEGSSLEKRIADLYDELAARGIQFRPHFWLSDEWFTPDGVPGIAIPFYLAHPRLARLEREQMLEVEGGASWCMRILRHEVGHAIDNAYCCDDAAAAERCSDRRPSTTPSSIRPSRTSQLRSPHRQLVCAEPSRRGLRGNVRGVAQPRARSGAGGAQDWPALKKLEYMDELMRQIASQPPLVDKRTVDPLHRIRRTLRRHYRRKAEHYALDYPDFYDRDLRRLFPQPPEDARTVPASRFINRIRKDVRRTVAAWTGVYQY